MVELIKKILKERDFMAYICQNKNCALYQDPVSEKRASMNSFICDMCKQILILEETDNYVFYEEVFITFPTPIAREYYRLKEILKTGKPVSAMLQLKDLVEITLKTIVSVGLSDFYTNTLSKQEEKEKITPVLLKPLGISLGDWVNMGQELSKLTYLDINKHKFSDFLRFFHNDFTIDYRKSSSVDKKKPVKIKPFITWRNELLGHGALRLDENSYLQDVRDYLIFLDYVFRQELNFFKDWEMNLKDKEKTIIKGINFLLTPEHTAHDKVTKEYIGIELSSLSLYPFMRFERCPAPGCNQKDIFLFDSDKKEKCYFLDYFRGHKFDRKEVYEPEIKKLKNFIPEDYKFTYTAFEINKTLNDILYSRSFEKEFIPPLFLYEELKKVLTLKSGYFYLISEGGIGKSHFIKGLEKEISDSTVLSFYIKRKLHDHLHQFVMDIDEAAKSKLGRVSVQIQLESAKNPEKLRLNFTKWAETLIRENYINKLIIAIDGLDDMSEPYNAEPSLPDIFPAELPENCYVIFTSRFEVPSFVQKSLVKLKQQKDFYTFTLNPEQNTSYQALLREYLEENLREDLKTEENIKSIINKAKSKFLYVYHFKNILNEGIVIKDTERIPSYKELYPGYMKLVMEKFSQVGQKNYLDVLLLLTASLQPLTTEMIGDMLHIREENVIPALYDFAEFLKSDRKEETYYDIAHNDFEEYLKEKYRDDLKNIHFSLASQILEKYKENWKEVNWHSPSERYLMEELLNHAKMSGDEGLLRGILIDEKLAGEYMRKGEDYCKKAQYEKAFKVCSISVEFYSNLVNSGRLDFNFEYDLAYAYMNLGSILDKLTRYEDALLIFNRAIDIYKGSFEGNLMIGHSLASVYMNRGITLKNLNRYDEAITEYNLAISTLNYLTDKGFLITGDILARIYNNLGITLKCLTRYEESIIACNYAIKTWEILIGRGWLELENALASGYNNLGISLGKLNRYEEAIKEFKRVIEIRKRLVESGRLEIGNDLATAYGNLGIAFNGLERHEEAIEEFNRAIDIWKKLIKEGRRELESQLASTHVNLGNTFRDLTNYREVVNEYGNAIDIWKKLIKEGRRELKNQLAFTYMNQGNIFIHLNYHEKAIENFKNAIKILNCLLQEGDVWVYSDILSCYQILILLYSRDHNNREYAINIASDSINTILIVVNNREIRDSVSPFITDIFRLIIENHLWKPEHEEIVKYFGLAFNIVVPDKN